MHINKFHNDVYEVENFITDEEQEYFLSLAYKHLGDSWHEDDQDYPSFWKGKNLTLDFSEFETIFKRIEDLFISKDFITQMLNIQRYRENEAMGIHKDHCLDDDNVKYGVVLYFNDNYLGGEIFYPDLNIEIKPKAKSLVIHGGEVWHGTKPVSGENTRYFATAFVKGTEEKPAILDPNLFR